MHRAPFLLFHQPAQAARLGNNRGGSCELACECSWPHSGTEWSVSIIRPGDILKSLQASEWAVETLIVPSQGLLCPSQLLNFWARPCTRRTVTVTDIAPPGKRERYGYMKNYTNRSFHFVISLMFQIKYGPLKPRQARFC